MATDFSSKSDMLRHAGVRAAAACVLTPLVSSFFLMIPFGIDPSGWITVGSAYKSALVTGALVAALLAAVFSYRTAILMRDLTMARKELFRLSRTDKLTGLLNRRGFDELANNALGTQAKAAVLMCDIDNFKGVNDKFGHDFGDYVLVAIANFFDRSPKKRTP